MNIDKIAGWVFVLLHGYLLITGIFTNDMGGLANLGYNPDMPMSFAAAPGRFLLGILINGGITIYGIRLITGATTMLRR